MISAESQSAYSQTQTHASRILKSFCTLIPVVLPVVSSTWKPVQLPSPFVCVRSIFLPGERTKMHSLLNHLSLTIPKRKKSSTTVAIPEQALHGPQENKDPKTVPINQNAPREETETNKTREEHPHPPPDSESRLRQLHKKNKLESATVPELKEFLRNHNQKVSGKKEDLITRVQTLLSWNVFYSYLTSRI